MTHAKTFVLHLVVPALLLVSAPDVHAQVATVCESLQVFRTYPYSDPDPVARISNIYPYYRFQGYSNQPVQRPWKIITLENPYIRVLVAPEIGGKILGAFEKSTGRAFVYFNRVIKFREIAMRGPWTSGGIEFNFGDIGHAPTTASPVDYVTRNNPDGSVSCIVGALDLPSRTEWRVEIRVPPDRALFETRSTWSNPTDLTTSFYHWMNAAADADSTLQMIYPGNAYIGHGGERSAWPEGPGGRDLTKYRDNAFGSYKSYHVLGVYTDYFGARWGDFGVIHWSRYTDKPGKKLWIWGLSREGEIWKDLLTDPMLGNTQYVEFQSGLHFNQAMMQSSRTPFKHMQFLPATADRFSETWFPFRGVGGVTRATPEGVLYVQPLPGMIRFTFCPTGDFRGDIAVRSQDGEATSRTVSLRPLQSVTDSVAVARPDAPFEITVGRLIHYASTDDSDRVLRRPAAAEAPFDWASAYGLCVDAQERERQRDYAGALSSYRLSVEKDPTFLPGLAGMAELLYRRMEYDSSFSYARRGLAIDAYDPGSNYYYGLAARKLNRPYDARDGFGFASRSREYRAAAQLQIAEIAFTEGEWGEASEFAARCLSEDGMNEGAGRLTAVLRRRTGDTTGAEHVLDGMISRDPLNHFARCERYLLVRSGERSRAFTAGVRNELPHESYMEIAAYYIRLRLWDDAAAVLHLAPPHPMVDLYRAYVASRLGADAESREHLAHALASGPSLVFPHRQEEMDILRWALSARPHWKTRYYLALLTMSLGKSEEAADLMAQCGEEPDFGPFFLARAALRGHDTLRALSDYRRALSVAPDEWRSHNAIIEYLNAAGRYGEALVLADGASRRFPSSYILRFLLARTLLFNGAFASSLAILDTLNILPFEGARYGRDAYRQACVMRGMEFLQGRDTANGFSCIERARLWPERLGAGEPYGADTRIEDYIEAEILRRSGQSAKGERLLGNIARYTLARKPENNVQQLIGAFALRDLGRSSEAVALLRGWVAREPGNESAQWTLNVFQRRTHAALEKRLRSSVLNRSTGDQDFVLLADVVSRLPFR